MKKLLFIVFALIAFTSCRQTVTKTDLPIEIVKLKESNQFDTTYTIQTDKKVFLFNGKKEYVGSYKIENDDLGGGMAAGIMLMAFLIAIVLLIIA